MVKYCQRCGKEIFVSNHYAAIARKYCEECAADSKRERVAEYMRRRRAESRAIKENQKNEMRSKYPEDIEAKKRLNDSAAYEKHCAEAMKKNGFEDVHVIGKQGDFGADIIAKGIQTGKIVVQCKHYSKQVGVKAVQEVNAARQYYGARSAAVATNSTFTKQARELARKCRVKLWERY